MRRLTIVLTAVLAIPALAGSAQAAQVEPGDPDYQWLFDEGTGTTIADTGALGAAKTANFNGSPSWSTATPFAYAGNNSLGANDTGGARVNAFNVDMGTQTTISMWVQRTIGTGSAISTYAHDTSGGTGRTLWYYNRHGNTVADSIYWDQENLTNSGLGPLGLDQWTHLALVRNGTNVDVYENGSPVNSRTVSGAGTTFGTLHFGSRVSNNEWFVGNIDEYAYWTSALTSDNIEWLSQNSLNSIGAPPGPPVPEPATIGVDMETGGATEPGFASLTPASPTATVEGVTFAIAANPTSGVLTARDRGATPQSPSDVLRDFVFDSNWGGPLGLFLDVSGMAAGTYDVESWHYGKNFGERTDVTFDMVFVQGATETVVASGHWTTDALSYQITTDGSDFTMEYRDTWPASSDTRFNGITFTPVPVAIPEPATMCALGLAVAGLGGYVRRRRKLS